MRARDLQDRRRGALSVLPGTWDTAVDADGRTFTACQRFLGGEEMTSHQATARCLLAVAVVRRFAGDFPAHVCVQDGSGHWHSAVAVTSESGWS